MSKSRNLNDWLDDYVENEYDDVLLHDDLFNRRAIDELSKIYGSLKETDSVKEKEHYNSESLDETVERLKLDSEVIHSFTANAADDRKLKTKYAKVLIIILGVQLIFFNAIFVVCGLGKLNYPESILKLYVGGGLLEIISLVAIIVKYLFKDNISLSLNSILEKNKKNK